MSRSAPPYPLLGRCDEGVVFLDTAWFTSPSHADGRERGEAGRSGRALSYCRRARGCSRRVRALEPFWARRKCSSSAPPPRRGASSAREPLRCPPPPRDVLKTC